MKNISFNLGVVLILMLAMNANAFSQTFFKQSLDSIVSEQSKYIYSYDNKGNNTLNVGYYWSDTRNSWVGDYKYEYAYDNSGNEIMQILYGWDNATNNWRIGSKFESTYDNNDNKTTSI